MTKLYFATKNALAILALDADCCRCDLHLNGREVQCVAVDPQRPQLMYCGTFDSGLWRSDDAGRSWRPAGGGIRHPRVLSVAVSRSERVKGSGVVYAGTEPSTVFRSQDAGETWWECTDLTNLRSASAWSFPPRAETHHVRWIEPDPHVAGRIFVAIEAGALVRSPDAGTTWRDRTLDGPRDTHQLPTHRSNPGRLYSAAGDGYFESRDAGDTWQRFEDGLRHKYLWSVAVDAGDADNIILSAATSARHSHYDEHPESHIYRRRAASPWQEVRAGLPDSNGRHSAVVAAHPEKPGIFFAAWELDVFRSVDGGATWERLNASLPDRSRINELCQMAVIETD
jgi:hypothetical protein